MSRGFYEMYVMYVHEGVEGSLRNLFWQQVDVGVLMRCKSCRYVGLLNFISILINKLLVLDMNV